MFTKYPHILAFVAILLGVLFFYNFEPPRHECQQRIDNFKAKHQSDLYFVTFKKGALPPRLKGSLKNCREGNNSGACFDFIDIMNKLTKSLDEFDFSCRESLSQEEPIRSSLLTGAQLLIEIAWGEFPPETKNSWGEGTWLEYSDYSTFCRIKRNYIEYFGQESFMKEEKSRFLNSLPGEPPQWVEDKCLNCENRKKAIETIGWNETKKRSLLSLNCSRF